MLTDLAWLEPGKAFPPVAEEARLLVYEQNEAFFLSRHAEVWQASFERLARQISRSAKPIDAVFNYHQLLTKKTADFICGEPPELEIAESNTANTTDGLDAILRKQRFFAKLYELFIDVSRFGNGIAKIVDTRLSVVAPRHWFPIVDPADLKEITQHVIAYPIMPDDDGIPTQLYVEIHSLGTVEIRQHSLIAKRSTGDASKAKGLEIGNMLEAPRTETTRLEGFAVLPLTNVTHSSSIYGLDDYSIINSLIEKLIWRLHCADIILDKHSEPSMSGPSSALEWDNREGGYIIHVGNFFKRDGLQDPEMSYITWNGNLESNFKEIDLLLNQIYVLTEMGAAFMEGNSAGGSSSGTALKLRLVSPRIKAQRLVGLNDATVRDMIAAVASANGLHFNPDDLQLSWQDGLPSDPVEDANRRNIETAGKQTKSQWTAIKERGLSDDEVEEELEQMREEAMISAPNILATEDPFAQGEPFEQEELDNGQPE